MTVDACIGLEALLSRETTELAHRLSLRAAAALASRATAPRDATRVYNMMKTVYSHRSAIVHGASNFKYRYVQLNGEKKETSYVATILLRELLLDLLERIDPWTPETLDETILRSLCESVPETDNHNLSG